MPILVIIAFNSVIFALVSYVFFKHSKKSFVRTKKKQEIVLAVVRIVGVMVLFGLTWILGAFTIKGASLLFQWLFVICNTLQGVFIFLLFVVVNKNVQTEFKSFVSSHSGSLKLHSQGSKSYSVDTGTLKSLKSDRPSVFLTDKKKALESTVSSKAIEVSMEMETLSDEPNSPSVVFDEKKALESTENTKATETSEALSDEPSVVLTDIKESTVNTKATAVFIEMDTSVANLSDEPNLPSVVLDEKKSTLSTNLVAEVFMEMEILSDKPSIDEKTELESTANTTAAGVKEPLSDEPSSDEMKALEYTVNTKATEVSMEIKTLSYETSSFDAKAALESAVSAKDADSIKAADASMGMKNYKSATHSTA